MRETEGGVEVREHEAGVREVSESRGSVEHRLSAALRELEAREGREETISRRLREAFDDLERREQRRESTESRLREALESLEENNDIAETSAREEIEPGKHTIKEHPRINYIEKERLKEVFRDLRESESTDVEEISTRIEDLARDLPRNGERIRIGDLSQADISGERISNIEDLLRNQGQEVRESLRERFANEKSDDIRVGLVKEKLYIWTPDTSPNDMIYSWRTQYFYMDTQDASRITEETGRKLKLGIDENQRLTNLNDLMQQFADESNYSQICIKDTNSRLTGEALRFCRDAIGIDTRDFEGKVRRIAGANGHGGIENPKFPTGKDLEELRARLMGTVVSDCYVRPDGIVELTEKNLQRIERFKEETLRKFGDFTKEPRFSKEANYYRLKMPSPYGRALNEWSIPSGDRTILNYGLPKETENWSREATIAYLQDMISQEGHIAEGKIRWERSNVLNPGQKADGYDMQPKLTQPEIELLIDKGHHYPGDYDGEKTLRWNKIKELTHHESLKIAETAKELCNVINENRNRLMDDEEKIANRLGIHLEVNPEEVAVYRSGRISVKWEARTNDTKSMIRWALVCSPNHPEKEVALNKWLAKHDDEEVQQVINELQNEGFNVSNNWREDIR